MNNTVIQAEGLSKLYRRGLQVDDGLRHSLEAFLRSPVASLRRKKKETFWALKDVSLEIREGEVLGLIGRNGAGKTTLLKILSRITRPTTGWAEIHGRVGSLLEVGTGFHPELTGRENTFLSGAILGMGKAEIARKFDEIVAFAEVEKFIDTPVKHYSSGMYVRLAFAVAAHLEPEILIVDEVLAVGDAAFQKKCLGKMGKVAREGRTVVFVSHNMTAIECLCSSCLLFEQGQLKTAGEPRELIRSYLSVDIGRDSGEKDLSSHPGRMHNSEPIMKNVALLSRLEQPVSSLSMGASLAIQVTFFCNSKALRPDLLACQMDVSACQPRLPGSTRPINRTHMTSNNDHVYDDCFFDRLTAESLASAKVIVPLLLNLIPPRSVIDIGCGQGAWLKVFKEYGVEVTLGLDGPWVNPSKLLIDKDNFRPVDL